MRGLALGGSVVLHAAAIAASLWRPQARPAPPPQPVAIEVVPDPVLNDPGRREVAADPSPAPAPDAPPAPALPQAPSDVPPPPPPPTPAAKTGPQAAAVNLGDAQSQGDGQTDFVEGAAVGPAPDPAHRNIPPRWPPGAGQRGEAGLVQLEAHVDADGVVDGVRVANGSGYQDLDLAARDAVRKWRFAPARTLDGRATDAVVPLSFDFTQGPARTAP